MTPVARSRGKAGSAVESGSRGACALRAGSATSGSTSACGTTGRPAERCTGRHRGKKRNSRARGQAGRGVAWTYVRGRRSRGSGTGKATRAPVTGAPRCRWWTARSRCWPCAGRPEKRAKRCASAWGRTRSSCAQRTTARSSRPTGRLPGRASFFFAQPYRGLNEHTNGLVRQYKATGKLDPAEPRGGSAQQPAAQGAGLPDSGGSFQAGVDRGPAPLKRNLTRLPARLAGAQDRTNGVPPRRDRGRGRFFAAAGAS